jgi:hypothetical protein
VEYKRDGLAGMKDGFILQRGLRLLASGGGAFCRGDSARISALDIHELVFEGT